MNRWLLSAQVSVFVPCQTGPPGLGGLESGWDLKIQLVSLIQFLLHFFYPGLAELVPDWAFLVLTWI